MEREKAERRAEELRKILIENSRRYYVDNAPLISDREFDFLMRELEDIENAFPDLAVPDSPTKKVGSDLMEEGSGTKEFVQYPHKYPMLSLGNTYSIEEVEDFVLKSSKAIGKAPTYCCELKFDGTAICLTYKNGLLQRALTRGDGSVGDDVTNNVRRISNIPLKLSGASYPEEFEIRGEILMPYESFEKLNKEREEEGEALFANPRNAAAGSLKLLDSAEVGRRGLYCTLYQILGEDLGFKTHKEGLEAAASWGLPVSDKSKICLNISEIEEYISYWDKARKTFPYATDGIVIKINEREFQEELGFTSKFPKWAVAYKFKAEEALTKLLSIDYQVGRTGAITPVANLEAVQLSGTVVKRATLNNADQMELLDIRVGDYVYVEKGGEIIPKITRVELSKRSDELTPPLFPTRCPDCGTVLERAESEAKHFCPNSSGCPTQIKGRLLHFMGRKAMNILAGEATVDQLYEKELARTPADLYDLNKGSLMEMEGWKERSAQRFLKSLDESRKVPFGRVLFALGIRYVGESTAKEIASHFGNIENIAEASIENLLEVKDIGSVIAESVYEYFRKGENLLEIERLKKAGLQFSSEKGETPLSSALSGKIIVISGNFSLSREEMKALIEKHGGKNSGSISGKTDYLLAGTKAGPEKLKKAQESGIKIISEEEFMNMLPDSHNTPAKAEEELGLFSNVF